MSVEKYPHLFEPFVIGKQVFKNRLFSSPTGHIDLTYNNSPTRETAAYYERRARGGVASVTIGECCVRKDCNGSDLGMYMGEPANIGIFNTITSAVRRHGAVCSAELTHWGKYANYAYPDVQSYGCLETECLDCGAFGAAGKHVLPMTEELIEDAIKAFADAAAYAKHVGFNMITIHAAHGWLIPEFMSPNNNRKDRWGGSFENRMRLPIAIAESVRRVVGPNFPIEFRMSATMACEGEYDFDFGLEVAKTMQEYADILHISAGHHMEGFGTMLPSMFHPDRMNVKYAAEISKHVDQAMIATVGAIDDPEAMEEIIASGQADIIEMARPLMVDPDLPNKIRTGREDEIRKCLRCTTCFSALQPTQQFTCSINPRTGRELDNKPDMPAAVPQKVLIIGGGPGGMQAALTCAENGHTVILCDKKDQLGGALRCETSVPFKKRTINYLDLQARLIDRNPNITVELGREVKPEDVKSFGVDAVIVAIGSKPFMLPIPGIEKTISGEAAFANIDAIGDHVAIMGAGLVGCELALHLARNGRKVEIVEMTDQISGGDNFLHVGLLMEQLAGEDVTFHFNTKAVEVEDGALIGETAEGERVSFEADTVVCAVGTQPLYEEAFAFSLSAPMVHMIGDCTSAATIHNAVHDAFTIANDIGRIGIH